MIGNDEFDQRRSLRSIIIGVIVSIPSYEWFLFLGRRFNYRSSVLSIGAKVAVNQLFYAPLFIVYFFAFHGLLSGEGIMGAVERVKNTVPTSIPRSFLYWPLVTAFNFTYVKPQSRSVATSLFAVFWQSYLSWLNNWAQKEAS
jgi:protein Mpv17